MCITKRNVVIIFRPFYITKRNVVLYSGKAAGPSGIVAEMLKPVGEAGAEEVPDLVENIISEGCIPTDWQESFIVNLYKGKEDALNRDNYRGLKLIEQVMKVLERVVEGLIRQRVEIDDMQCGFMSGLLLMRFFVLIWMCLRNLESTSVVSV